MDVAQMNSEIRKISSQSEKNFLALADIFPSLMSNGGGTSLEELKKAMVYISEANGESAQLESDLFDGYAEKYNPLFEQLNNKISDLSELDRLIALMKENSEQMELIALNAMVISIKSGEKGHAFSRITENLQRLSNDMFLYSDKLLDEEKRLLDDITRLKEIFEAILASQKKLSSTGSSGTSDIQNLVTGVNNPLSDMGNNINGIYPHIQKAMECLQLQDIIRQALEHVEKCLAEVAKTQKQVPGSDEELDSLSFNIALYKLSQEVLEDVSGNINESLGVFQTNWDQVTSILNQIQAQKESFQQRFLDDNSMSVDNIQKKLNILIEAFQEMINEFGRYHVVQKDLLHVCQNITEKARTMYAVFENLRPVMSRLHHVRILQQIEVSKNDAIATVKDSVTDMDNLINQANKSLDTMHGLLESFIKETGVLLNTFTSSISKDNSQMRLLRTEKNNFFDELKSTKNRIASIINNFTVFPAGFERNCEGVDLNLTQLQSLGMQIKAFIGELKNAEEDLLKRRDVLFQQKALTSWQIKNDKFSELINHFTITAHKEAAGKIGGFSIESGAGSGEITFF